MTNDLDIMTWILFTVCHVVCHCYFNNVTDTFVITDKSTIGDFAINNSRLLF